MVTNYLVFPPGTTPHLLRTIEPVEHVLPPDADRIEIDEALWGYLEANRDEIKLYELTPEGHLRKMTVAEYELKYPTDHETPVVIDTP